MIQRLLWTPRAKERPRTVMIGGRPSTFTPKATRDAEAGLAAQWIGPPAAGPIGVDLDMSDEWVEVSVYEHLDPQSRKLKRGDIDNYCKTILDGLNKHAWMDDRQIVQLRARKL